MDNKFKNFPPELIRLTLDSTEITPSLVQNLGKFMSKKAKSNMLTCSQLINKNMFTEIKKLKFYDKTGCTHSDFLLAVSKNYEEIVKYIIKEYNIKITKKDIIDAIKNDDYLSVKLLLKLKPWKYEDDINYIKLFGYTNKINMLKLIYSENPNSSKLSLEYIISVLFLRDRNFINFDLKYFSNLIKAGIETNSLTKYKKFNLDLLKDTEPNEMIRYIIINPNLFF